VVHAPSKHNTIGIIPIQRMILLRTIVFISFIAAAIALFLILTSLFFSLDEKGRILITEYTSVVISISIVLILGAFIYQHVVLSEAAREKVVVL
jgi:hypothetical protein